MKKMKQWKTTNAYWVFLVLSGRSNAYLIRKGNQNVLVDTGKETAYKRLEKNFHKVTYKHVRREANTIADKLVNKAINLKALL